MKMKRLFGMIILSCVFFMARGQFIPSDADSKVHFVIKNFGIRTGGDFTGLRGTIKFNPGNPAASSFDVTVDASSIDTDNNSRDGHLRKEDYFDVKKYPVIKMVSTSILGTNKPGRYQFNGNLTIKSITKPVQFFFDVTPKNGGYLFSGDDFKINRRDFGVGGNSVSLSDDLKVSLSVMAK